MPYKRITTMDIYEIIRRWHSNQSITHIAAILDYDRKTVRKYINHAIASGIASGQPLPAKEQILREHTFNGRPLGDKQFIMKLEKQFNRCMTLRKRGRKVVSKVK